MCLLQDPEKKKNVSFFRPSLVLEQGLDWRFWRFWSAGRSFWVYTAGFLHMFLFWGGHYWVGQPHKRSSLQALHLFYRRREKSCHWRTWQRRFEDGISHKRIYMNLSVCMWVRPLASGAMMVHAGPGRGSPPQKLQCFGCYAKVPALILDQPGPTQRPSKPDKYGKTSPSQHIYIYITGVFFLDPKAFHYCFLAWLHTISTYKKNIKGRKLYYTPTTHESLWQGDFRAQSCSGRTMLELVNDISPNCLEIPGGKTPSFRKWNNQHRFCIYPKHIKYDVMVLRSYFWSTNRWLKVIFCLPAIRSLSRFYSYNSCISCQVKITNQTCFCSSLLLDCFQ